MYSACVVAPYTKSEITLAAIQIADWLRRIGFSVYFLSTTPVYGGIHKYWDNNAISPNNFSKRDYAVRVSTHVCFFSSDNNIQVKAKDKKTIFFPGWSGYWDSDYESYLQLSSRVICLSHAMSNWLDTRYRDINKTWATLVSPDQLLIPKNGAIDLHSSNILVYVPKSVEIDVPVSYIDTFQTVSDKYSINFSFLFERTLNKKYRKAFNRVKAQQYKKIPVYQYGNIVRQHDVVYLLNTRHTYGSMFSFFNLFNTPIICNHVSPVLEHIPSNLGCIIPANLYEKPIPISGICDKSFTNNIDYICNNFLPWLKNIQEKQISQLKHMQFMFERFLYQEFVE